MQSLINPSTPLDDNWTDLAGRYGPSAQSRVESGLLRQSVQRRVDGGPARSGLEAYGDAASKIGLVACVLFYAVTAAYGLSLSGQWSVARKAVASAVNEMAVKAGFGVEVVQIEGRRNIKSEEIDAAIGPRDGVSVFAFDTAAARDRLKRNGWVAEARVMRLLPSTLVIEIEERKPFALWREGGRTAAIDAGGNVLSLVSAEDFPGLPVVSGAGAASPSKELLDALAVFPELQGRIREIERIAGRRWDLVMDTGLRVKLPASGFVEALSELSEIAEKNRAAFYEISEMDFRIPSQFTLRLKDSSDRGRRKFLSWLSGAERGESQGL